MAEMLIGAIAACAFIIGVFFLRFWRSSGDSFFLLFAAAFWLEGGLRVFLYRIAGGDEASPLYYIVRLVAYSLIIVAIVAKNRRGSR